jgi:hypothetical protein
LLVRTVQADPDEGVTAAETQRIWWAIQLARDIDTCCSLLRGEPVDEESLDPVALKGARQRGSVVLCSVLDLFAIEQVAA